MCRSLRRLLPIDVSTDETIAYFRAFWLLPLILQKFWIGAVSTSPIIILEKAYGKTMMTGACALISAICLDAVVLGAFLIIKGGADPMIVVVAIASIVSLFGLEKFYLSRCRAVVQAQETDEHG